MLAFFVTKEDFPRYTRIFFLLTQLVNQLQQGRHSLLHKSSLHISYNSLNIRIPAHQYSDLFQALHMFPVRRLLNY